MSTMSGAMHLLTAQGSGVHLSCLQIFALNMAAPTVMMDNATGMYKARFYNF